MPNKINWSIIDPLIIKHLSSMTYVDFCKKFIQDTAPGTISKRAKKLNIKQSSKSISNIVIL